MTTTTALFNYNDHKIRVIEIDGQPWFVGADVQHILFGRANGMGHTYSRLAPDEMSKVKRIHLGDTPGKDMTLISESGLYKLIMRSDKPEARAFQDWVTRIVPPRSDTGGDRSLLRVQNAQRPTVNPFDGGFPRTRSALSPEIRPLGKVAGYRSPNPDTPP